MYPIKTKTKYDPNNLAASANTYTTVYLGNYVAGDYGEGDGSHPGVDIVPMTTHDTVASVLDGVVKFAGTNASEGNYVVVRHDGAPHPDDASKTTTLFSCYLHLSELGVATGDTVKEGDPIGKTGNTGQSTGEHLHFQIDRAEALFHPYWPFTFGEAQEAGLGFFDAVNRGLGLEKARKFTVNPLVYLDSIAGKTGATASSATASVPATTATVAASAGGGSTAATTTASFSDVPASSPYAAAIAFVKDHGIASGSNGMFRPNDTVTRGEILKMAFNASARSLSSDSTQHFSDVAPDNSFFAYVNTARESGAVGGYPDGTFRPNNPVTRAEALKIALGIMNIVPDSASFQVFNDVPTTAWVAPYANWAKTMDLFDDGSGNFRPDASATRAEVAGIIYAAKTA
jgi:hypothetical protein